MPVNFAPCVAPCATVGLLSHRLKSTLSQAGAVPSGATCASPRCASHSLRLAVASAEPTLSQAWGNTSPTSSRRVRQSRTRRRWAAAHPAPKAKGPSDRPLETFGPIIMRISISDVSKVSNTLPMADLFRRGNRHVDRRRKKTAHRRPFVP